MIDNSTRIAVSLGFVLCLIPIQALAGPMTAKELEALYSKDVTECGVFKSEGMNVPYCEHFRNDRKIIDPETGEQIGTYRIDRKKALVCLQYRGEAESCSHYVHKSGNTYNVEYSDGSRGDVAITKGLK